MLCPYKEDNFGNVRLYTPISTFPLEANKFNNFFHTRLIYLPKQPIILINRIYFQTKERIGFLLPLHQVPGSVEPLAYYMRRETHIPGFLCPGISVFIAAVQS